MEQNFQAVLVRTHPLQADRIIARVPYAPTPRDTYSYMLPMLSKGLREEDG